MTDLFCRLFYDELGWGWAQYAEEWGDNVEYLLWQRVFCGDPWAWCDVVYAWGWL